MKRRTILNKTERQAYRKVVPVKLDKSYWQEILKDGKLAKHALINLEIGPNKVKVKGVRLENGNEIPITEVTEQQALDFMTKLCPARFLPKNRQ